VLLELLELLLLLLSELEEELLEELLSEEKEEQDSSSFSLITAPELNLKAFCIANRILLFFLTN